MNHPVVAIGLDSVDPVLLETWMAQGHLKNLRQLKEQGAYGRLTNMDYYKGESAWTNFLTGCLPHKTGYWSKYKFDPEAYEANKIGTYGAYSYDEYAPFYALGDRFRVAMFDMPQTTLSNQVNGIQVLAWGAHAPMISRQSQPPELISDLISQYGDHPADALHHQDRSDWYDPASVAKLKQDLEVGLKRRTAITRDLLGRENWNLFLTDIGETHTAAHYFWHLSQPEHPLYQPKAGSDPMLEFFEAVDQSLGAILAEAPKDAHILVFSVHGMGENSADLLSMVMLPEFLYRFSFPGQALLKSQPMGETPPPPLQPKKRDHWYKQIHTLKQDPDPIARFFRWIEPIVPNRLLTKTFQALARLRGTNPELYSWHPARWYKPFWPQMKAFYLPGFSDGYIRINLQGRESHGTVSASEYHTICDQLIQQLHLLTDARTGRPIVKNVVRTRQDPLDRNPKLPDADLVVLWEDWAVDTVDSPTYGRMGPVFYNRSGAHRSRGFLLANGPGIPAGSDLAEGHAVDLAPTILKMMNAPIPQHLDGKPLTYSDGTPLVGVEVEA